MLLKICAASWVWVMGLPVSGFTVVSQSKPVIRKVLLASATGTLVEEDFGAAPERKALLESENPGGCSIPKDKSALKNFNGVYPIDEFEEMLATRTGVVYYNHRKNYTLGKTLPIPWCPKPLPHGSFFESRDGVAHEYVQGALAGTDPEKPLILALVQSYPGHEYHFLQVTNFLCGFQRLGLEGQLAVVTMSSDLAVALRRLHPWLRVLYHPSLLEMFKAAGHRTNIRETNRVAKLVLSEMLVHMNREVVLSDLDVMWIQNPLDYITAVRTPTGALPDMLAMRDNCWLEMNSGFVYYRPTSRTKNLLRMALSTQKFDGKYDGQTVRLIADNDQYLLNCALARSAVDGLNYVILPSAQFKFGSWNPICRNGTQSKSDQVSAPMVWHTSGFSISYELEFDRFAALGLVDVDAGTGQCAAGHRGSAEDVENVTVGLSHLCDTGPDGIVLASCYGDCSAGVAPRHARELLAQFSHAPI